MRFPVGALILIMIAGICFFMWVVFNYAYMGEGGLREILWSVGNSSIDNPSINNAFSDNMVQMRDGFGLAGVFCIGLAIMVFVVDVMRREPGDMY